MIETSRGGRRALAASALGGFSWLTLCAFGGTHPVASAPSGGGPSASGSGASGANALAPLEWTVSPDGRWLAVTTSRGRDEQFDSWLVSIDKGAARELREVERVAPQLAFDEQGRVRIYTLDSARGTPSIVWTDPTTGAVLESTRDRVRIRGELEPLEFGWAEVATRKSGDTLQVRSVEWPAARAKFELDAKRDVEVQLSEAEGVVFYTRRVGDQLRLVRREMREELDITLVAEGRGLAGWSVSHDGRTVAVHERSLESRVRVIDSRTGALAAGPWAGESVAWAPGRTSRHLEITFGGQTRILDTLRDKSMPAGDWRRFAALEDGSFVAELEGELVLFDMDLGEQRVLFERPSVEAQAQPQR